MIKSFYKIITFLKIFLIYFLLTVKSFAGDEIKKNNLIVMGPDSAIVKIKVFSSFTCPHCANFHKNVVSKIKEKYLDSNQVQIIFIDFPLDQASFNASKILHCLDKKNQMLYMDSIYENQKKWTDGSSIDEINDKLKKIAVNFEMDSKKFNKCINNEKVEDKILNGRIVGAKKYSIDATPTSVINEKKFKENVNFENINKKIEKLI